MVADDAGEIIAKLKEDGIPTSCRMAAHHPDPRTRSRNPLEPCSFRHAQGGTVGFELFNQSQLGSTDFDRQLKYNWALQGELVRTIRQLNEIADARVHIVQTGQSLFVEEEQPATASVFLKVKPMKSLEKEQIQAIANLVAGSVKGLKPENVTILDQYGRLLSEEIDLGSDPFKNKAVAGQLELKRNYERELERSIQSMLERVYGPGKAVARVNAELDFDWSESNLKHTSRLQAQPQAL